MSDQGSTRRRVLLGAGTVVGLAGCAGLGDETGGTSPTATLTQTPTQTESETSTPTETDTGDTDEGPGYKHNHWHGRLFFEIDSDLVDFDQSKYYLDNIEAEEAVYFHFHDSAHGPNEWSNEKQIVTFQRALNLLPGISHDRSGGEHVVTYEGETFDGSASSTDISIHRGTETIDPTTYEVQHDDNFWVNVQTDDGPGGSDAERTGKLIVDVNNRRLNLQTDPSQEGDDGRFEFRDDVNPHTWYSSGEPVTLGYAFERLRDVTYERDGDGEHVITYKRDDELGGTYHAANDETQIIVRQRTTPVEPDGYELQDGDIIWVYVHTANAPDNEH